MPITSIFHVNHHHHYDGPVTHNHNYHHDGDRGDVDPIAELLTHVRALVAQGKTIMANEQDLQNDLDQIKAGIATVLEKSAAQAKTITDLQAQLSAGTPVSQEQLDALKTEADAIVATLTPVAS